MDDIRTEEHLRALAATLPAAQTFVLTQAADTIKSLRASLTRVEEERDEAVKVLRAVEWGATDSGGERCCPVCFASKQDRAHYSDCGLQTRLSLASATETERSE